MLLSVGLLQSLIYLGQCQYLSLSGGETGSGALLLAQPEPLLVLVEHLLAAERARLWEWRVILSINIKYNTILFDICAANKTKANYLHGVGGRGTWSWWWLSEAASASWSWAVAGSAAAPIASAPGPCPCLRPK